MMIRAIKENNKITRAQLASLIGKSVKTVERIIKESSTISHIGSPKIGHWVVKE